MSDVISRKKKKAGARKSSTRKTGTRPRRQSIQDVAGTLRAYALSLPDAWEDHPWGESVVKVRKKVFVFLGRAATETYSFSVKLPRSGDVVLGLPFTEPTGYGLGKSGWVTAQLTPNDVPPVEMLCAWLEESYRAIAPKKLVELLDERTSTSSL